MVQIAMWSGPRNLSTAMMYAFGVRDDFGVWDEPFYAAFLAKTGVSHPMREQILAAHESDPAKVAARCADPNAFGTPHVYMKHMAHHMVDQIPLGWAATCVNVHLIRHPARVIASYLAKRDTVTMEDIGFAQQTMLYDQLGGVVIDSFDLRQNPALALRMLCDAIAVPYDDRMLRWPRGGMAEDGVWASHWYGAVHQSTGFAGPEGPLPQVDAQYQQLLNEALLHYDKLRTLRLPV